MCTLWVREERGDSLAEEGPLVLRASSCLRTINAQHIRNGHDQAEGQAHAQFQSTLGGEYPFEENVFIVLTRVVVRVPEFCTAGQSRVADEGHQVLGVVEDHTRIY